jgi:hypothetical protein
VMPLYQQSNNLSTFSLGWHIFRSVWQRNSQN